ncbi:MAG TPA: hypothetical protein VGC79_24915 [Polyangiaceae bacterium]
MSNRPASASPVSLAALGVWLAACSLGSDLPGPRGSTAPASSGVTLNGVGAPDADAGDVKASRISDLNESTGSPPASAAGATGTAGATGAVASGGASTERAGQPAFSASGAAGVAEAGGEAGNDEKAGTASSPAADPPVIWFSEYIEGSSSNKALEITAQTRAVLDGCKVSSYFNGKTEATVVATLSGVLEAGQVLTLCTSTLKEKLPAVCNQVGNLTFNGDDVISLSCGGVILDVIGQIGVDPGLAWGSDPNTTADHSLRRECSASSGDADGSDAFDPSAHWQALPIDTFDGLGTRGCSAAR